MKVIGNVQVTSRLHPGTGSSRFQRASLTIGKQPGTQDLCVLYQTLQNKSGIIYKIIGNVERMFTLYLNEGKATIRFINPAHDVSINCQDKLQLKCFLQTLAKVAANKVPVADVRLSTLNQTSVKIPKAKTSLKITERSDYPILTNFPRTLQRLHINGIERKCFDVRILRLQNLKILDLTDNMLTTLPDAMGDLPALHTLLLGNNHLGSGSDNDWPWLNNTHLANTLTVLDLRQNRLTQLPNNLSNMQQLIHLDVSGNLLTTLFPGIGRVKSLRILNASLNQLRNLPASIEMLRLETLDLSHNPWDREVTPPPDISRMQQAVPTLIELGARALVNQRLPLFMNKWLPKRVLTYLYTCNFCSMCGSACFEGCISRARRFNVNDVADNVIVGCSGISVCPMETCFCSASCYRSYLPFLRH